MEIPFHGSSQRKAWTGGVPPSTSFGLRIMEKEEALKYLPEN